MGRALYRALLDTGLARLCSGLLAGIIALALFGPLFSPWEPNEIDWNALQAPPSASHWFGTDLVGRDLLVRTAMGAQVSLSVAGVATLVSMLIGVPWGAAAGYLGGRADNLMMRIVDVLYAIPFVLVVILLVVVFGRNPYLLFVGLGAVFWLDLARIVRGQTLRVRHEAYVDAARAMGATTAGILARHVIPNVAGPALVYGTLTIPGVILAESFISFLGLGVQEPNTSWGVLIADGAQTMESAPWALVFPAALLAVTVWSINMLGDRLRDQFDPRGPSSEHRRGPHLAGYNSRLSETGSSL
ncbi:MAG: ABC transporter permease [Gammaproteobacteria bacterium]|nr:ABC transporter permease [Gammaproteobacteria bacterium]